MSDLELREQVVAAARDLKNKRLTAGKSGNVSARSGEGFLITPTGVPYDELSATDIVAMGMDGKPRDPGLTPSSEWRIHRDLYLARQEFHAAVHTHSRYATALASTRRGIPAFHYMVAVAGGKDIRCAPYALFGSGQLSQHALAAIEGRKACLLANHGLIAAGETVPAALGLAEEVESLAEQYCEALKIGNVVYLSDFEMKTVVERFKTYGQVLR